MAVKHPEYDKPPQVNSPYPEYKLSQDEINDLIIGEPTFTLLPSGKLMVCELMLKGDHAVSGEAGVIFKGNYDEAMGRFVSYQAAYKKAADFAAYEKAKEVKAALIEAACEAAKNCN